MILSLSFFWVHEIFCCWIYFSSEKHKVIIICKKMVVLKKCCSNLISSNNSCWFKKDDKTIQLTDLDEIDRILKSSNLCLFMLIIRQYYWLNVFDLKSIAKSNNSTSSRERI